jgi:uncharacterized protein (TIGR00725 family)
MYVAVIGGQQAGEEEERTAYEVGKGLAEAGAYLVCGGLGGIMQAACRGAREAGGLTIGILPGPFRGDANPYVDVVIATDMGQARNAIIVRTADSVIAIGGEYGTLTEMAMALKMGKRVVAVDSWRIERGGRFDERIIYAKDAQEALRLTLEET